MVLQGLVEGKVMLTWIWNFKALWDSGMGAQAFQPSDTEMDGMFVPQLLGCESSDPLVLEWGIVLSLGVPLSRGR